MHLAWQHCKGRNSVAICAEASDKTKVRNMIIPLAQGKPAWIFWIFLKGLDEFRQIHCRRETLRPTNQVNSLCGYSNIDILLYSIIYIIIYIPLRIPPGGPAWDFIDIKRWGWTYWGICFGGMDPLGPYNLVSMDVHFELVLIPVGEHSCP